MSYINKRKEIYLSSTSIVNYFINYSTLEVHAFNFTYLDVGKEKSHHKTYFATSTNSQFFYLMINVVYFLFSTSQSTYYVLRDRHKNMFLRMGRIWENGKLFHDAIFYMSGYCILPLKTCHSLSLISFSNRMNKRPIDIFLSYTRKIISWFIK